jgi:hypothetical protein
LPCEPWLEKPKIPAGKFFLVSRPGERLVRCVARQSIEPVVAEREL